MRNLLLLAILCLTVWSSYAQKGTIRGVVMDGALGEPLFSATVVVQGTTNGSISDLDGKYEIQVDVGTVTLEFSYIGYKTITIENIEVKAGEVTVLNNVVMNEDVEVGVEVVVTAEAIQSSEASIINMKSKSANMIDGISSDKIRKTGDANVAEATKRIAGVTVEGGKYVYVRGLGDRYSKTTLNGVDVPGLDPDRNSIQMDIFPTNMVSNLVISKNFTAELPADFTGGLLDVSTKEFPDEKNFSISFSTAYNPQYHFNPNYLRYKGGSTDFLGFDDGTRRLPARKNTVYIPGPFTPGYTDGEVTDFIKTFNPTLGASKQLSILDFSGGFSLGNQINLKKKGSDEVTYQKLGYIFSLSYKSSFKHYDDVSYGDYQRDPNDATENELVLANLQEGAYSERNFLLAAFAGLAYKTNTSKYKLTAMHLQNGVSRAGQFFIYNNPAAIGQSGYNAASDNLEYNQRSLTNVLLLGKHLFEETNWEVNWRVSPTYSISEDPDIRKTAFSDSTDYSFNPGEAGNPSRIWRSLSELNTAAKIDITKRFNNKKLKWDLNFGASYTFKLRNYDIQTFNVLFADPQSWDSPDPNLVFREDNIYNSDNTANSTYIQSGNSSPNANQYAGNINHVGFYVSAEFKLFNKLRTILGVRGEFFSMNHTGRDIAYANGSSSGRNLENENVLETIKPFPSVNLVYEITSKMNLRASYTRTVARPSFKEMSFAQILDPVSNRIFNGSFFEYKDPSTGAIIWDGNLQETDINNIDLRWEYFLKDRAQFFSLSAFYKDFLNPIELVRISQSPTSAEFQPRNVGNGLVIGGEFEFKKNFDFISQTFADLALFGNFTYVYSQIKMSDVQYNARKSFEREGESIGRTRDMAGQSPWVINAGLSYENSSLGLEVGVFYNVKGPALMVVGTGLIPDVYSEPFHSLNFKASKTFGENQRTRLSLKVENMINDRRESFFRSYGATKQVFSSINPGFTFSIGVNHKFY